MNSIELAEENVRASLLKKLLYLSVMNCCKWSLVSEKLFQSLLNQMEQFSKTANRCATEAKESEFQTSVPCANLIKMKTNFQFILMNWNITSSKMVRKNIFEG